MSICVLHKDGWGVCDSRTVGNGRIIVPSSESKIIKAQGYLFACVGQAVLNTMVQKVVNTKWSEVDALDAVADMVREEKFDSIGVLACSYKKELFLIDTDGHLGKIDTDYWAMGAAEDYVLGRLHLVEELSDSRGITIDDAAHAIVVASKFDNTIDGRVHRVFLDTV